MPFKFGDVRKSLKKKGFAEDTSGDHIYLNHQHDGKATGPYTKVSHGADKDDVGPTLVRAMKGQLKLNSNTEVKDLVNCPMSAEKYLSILRAAKVIS
jgi:hypothetical protein